MKPRITIRLFGRLSLHCDDRELLLHTSGRAKELLCYLILARRAPVRRDELASFLSDKGSRKALRHALWQLNYDLGPQIAERILRIEKEWIQFVSDEGVWLDLAEFEPAAKNSLRSALAVEAYGTDLLPGWDQEWCLAERERLRQIYLETLDALITKCESAGDTKAGVAYAMLALHNDHTRECTHSALMRLYAASGDRHCALEQYKRCVEILRDELGVEPSDETKALVERIRVGHSRSSEARTGSTLTLSLISKTSLAAKGRGAGPK